MQRLIRCPALLPAPNRSLRLTVLLDRLPLNRLLSHRLRLNRSVH
jgi:hypothetical protein